jgi:predicted AlkP superfamily pyrophosphatase or phosphodiesterase
MRKILFALFVIAISFSLSAQQNKTPYVLLISFDGFRHDYVEKFNPPNFKAFIKDGAAADGLIPSFPSKTFPNHYTLVTGLYPGNHGLVDNQFYDPAQKKRYGMRDKKVVRDPSFYGGTPLWQLAQQQGQLAASYFWVGSEVSLHGQFPRYYFPYDESVPNENRIDQTIQWLKLPEAERPHFISLYFSLVDSEGHKTGPHSAELKETVIKADSLLGLLMTQLRATKLPVNVIIASDHGMYELKQEEKTYIPFFSLVNMKDTAHVFVNGGTQMHIYTNKVDSLYSVLTRLQKNFTVYRKKDLKPSWHYDHDRVGDLLVVADPGHYIQDQPRSFGSWSYEAFGVHGYDPAIVKDMQGIFYASGPNIKKGSHVAAFENVHVYPLIVEILGLKSPKIDGSLDVLKGILKK